MYRFSAHLGRLGVTSHKFSSLARSKVSCNSSFVYNNARCISSSQTGQMKNSQYPGQNNKRNNNLGLALGGGVLALGLALYANKENEVHAKSETEPVAEAAEPVDAEPQEEEPEILLPEIPEEAPYLIIGAGTAAFAAYRAIRARDPKAKVLVIGEETHMPYKRPPLSKELWYSKDRNLADQLRFKQWNGKEVSLFYLDDSSYCRSRDLPLQEDGGIAVVTGKKVVKLDVFAQTAHVDDGSQVKYEKCLIATGGKPKNLPVIEQAGPEVAKRTTMYRNINDFRSLNKITDEAKSIAIIGGGFMGSELACALGKKSQSNGMKIYQIFPESGNMAKVLPKYLTEWTSSKVVEQGITSVPNCYMNGCSFNEESNQVEIATNTGETVSVDHVIVAVGLEPSTEFAIGSDLEVDRRRGGFVVNAELEARTNVWAAGDASCFFDIKLGRRRVEHHDHAVVSGRLAGENMAGAHKPYWHQSMFWSDLGPDIGYEAIGLCDSTLDTVGVFFSASDKDAPAAAEQGSDAGMRTETKTGGDAEAAAKPGLKTVFIHTKDNEIASSTGDGDLSSDLGKGVIFYVRDDAIVGVLTWNIFGKMPIARKAISEEQKQGEIKELAQLFIKPKKK